MKPPFKASDYPWPNTATPTEVQAAMIADLEARLVLADEKQFFLMAENARLRAELEIKK